MKFFTSFFLAFIFLLSLFATAQAEEVETNLYGTKNTIEETLEVLKNTDYGRRTLDGNGNSNLMNCKPVFSAVGPEPYTKVASVHYISLIAEKVLPETIAIYINGFSLPVDIRERPLGGVYAVSVLDDPIFEKGKVHITISGYGKNQKEGCFEEYSFFVIVDPSLSGGKNTGDNDFPNTDDDPENEDLDENTEDDADTEDQNGQNSPCTPTYGPKINISAFADIANNAHKNSISFLQELKIVNGTKDGLFHPNKTITHAELIKILSLSVQCKDYIHGYTPVKPIAKNDWFPKFAFQKGNNSKVTHYLENISVGNPHNTTDVDDIAQALALFANDVPTADEIRAEYGDTITRGEASEIIVNVVFE